MNQALKHAWRQLPVGFRRLLAHTVLEAFAPSLPIPESQATAVGSSIVVVGFLTSASGLGQASRLAYRAFELQGRAVYGVDLSRFFFETADVVDFSFRDGTHHRGPARVLLNINAPHMAYAFNLLGRNFLRGKHVTSYWAWELPRAPEAWRSGFERSHAIATPSTFVATSLAALGGGPPIKVAPHPVALEDLPTLPARSDPVSERAPFVLTSSFNSASGFARKNPLALIEAFKSAFPNRRDVKLRMLASNMEHYPDGAAMLRDAAGGDSRIELTFDALDRDDYWGWYGRPDMFGSLHRAEGFGLALAESMILGVPVMATGWSANAEYMSDATALPVRYELVRIQDAQRKYSGDSLWAEADVAHAASLLRRAVNDPVWLNDVARAGQAHARRLFSTFDPWP